MLSVTRAVIEQSVAFLAFVIRILSVPMHRHQMVFDRLRSVPRSVHLTASRIEALSPFDHLRLWVLWPVFKLMASEGAAFIKPLRAHFALKASVPRVIVLRHEMRLHGRFAAELAMTVRTFIILLLQMDHHHVLPHRVPLSESKVAMWTLKRPLAVVDSLVILEGR